MHIIHLPVPFTHTHTHTQAHTHTHAHTQNDPGVSGRLSTYQKARIYCMIEPPQSREFIGTLNYIYNNIHSVAFNEEGRYGENEDYVKSMYGAFSGPRYVLHRGYNRTGVNGVCVCVCVLCVCVCVCVCTVCVLCVCVCMCGICWRWPWCG